MYAVSMLEECITLVLADVGHVLLLPVKPL